jgi:hypothetical protein
VVPRPSEVRAFDQARARVHESGVHRRHVGGGNDPGQAGVLEEHRARPAAHAHDAQVDVEVALRAEHQGQLPDRHAVAGQDRVEADEGEVLGKRQVPVQGVAPERVGPVEHDQRLVVGGAGLERVQHRGDERVVPRPHVLYVEHERVHARQHGRGGDARAAVEAEDGPARDGVARVFDLHQVLGVRPDAMFGPEERGQAHAPGTVQRRRRVDEVGRDRRGVGDEAEAQAAHELRAGEELIEAVAHGRARAPCRDAADGPGHAHST